VSNHNIRVDAIGLAAEVVELRNEIARLKNQTNWVCSCGGTDCEGQKENADLRNTLDAVIWADERAVELWRAAHPSKELVIPDRAKLVEWLLEQNAALRKDKDRLDWIFWPSRSRKARTRMLKLIGTPGYRGDEGGMLAWRDAIDAAMKEAQP
jgi:rhodanese-related sulfurtransferase